MWDTILVLKNIPIIVHVVVKMRNHRTVHPLYTIIKKYTTPPYAFYLKAPNGDGIVTLQQDIEFTVANTQWLSETILTQTYC